MTSNIKLPADKDLAKAVIDNQSKDRGWLGHVFGARENAPTNIAGFALILLAVMFCVVLFAPIDSDVPRSSLITALLSAFTFTLGLMFGRNTKSE